MLNTSSLLKFVVMQGTFLVRPSLSRDGCIVVSTVANEGGVKHLILEEDQLQERDLEVQR